MNGLNALITVAQHWRRWQDPRLVVLVLNNRDLNYVSWEQRVMEGNPRFAASQDLLDFPYAGYAELLGLRGIRVDSPDAVGPAWDEALAADRPVLFEAVTDPNVPTFPPELKPKQLEKLTSALSKGDPDAEGVIEQATREGYFAGTTGSS
jgi:pyruvate dehydrogenase (quinone)